jgi:hypothetical protein
MALFVCVRNAECRATANRLTTLPILRFKHGFHCDSGRIIPATANRPLLQRSITLLRHVPTVTHIDWSVCCDVAEDAQVPVGHRTPAITAVAVPASTLRRSTLGVLILAIPVLVVRESDCFPLYHLAVGSPMGTLAYATRQRLLSEEEHDSAGTERRLSQGLLSSGAAVLPARRRARSPADCARRARHNTSTHKALLRGRTIAAPPKQEALCSPGAAKYVSARIEGSGPQPH